MSLGNFLFKHTGATDWLTTRFLAIPVLISATCWFTRYSATCSTSTPFHKTCLIHLPLNASNQVERHIIAKTTGHEEVCFLSLRLSCFVFCYFWARLNTLVHACEEESRIFYPCMFLILNATDFKCAHKTSHSASAQKCIRNFTLIFSYSYCNCGISTRNIRNKELKWKCACARMYILHWMRAAHMSVRVGKFQVRVGLSRCVRAQVVNCTDTVARRGLRRTQWTSLSLRAMAQALAAFAANLIECSGAYSAMQAPKEAGQCARISNDRSVNKTASTLENTSKFRSNVWVLFAVCLVHFSAKQC